MSHIQDNETLSDKLIVYLRDKLDTPALTLATPLKQLQGGYETASYRLEFSGAPDALSKPLVLRLYPQFYGTRNAIWESTVQNALAADGYPVAQAHVVCTDMTVLGGAFFIMDFLPGQPLIAAPAERMPALLGAMHAALHNTDPAPLLAALNAQGISRDACRIAGRFDWLRDRLAGVPWLHQVADWLLDHRPPESEHPTVCHGDFHPLNILYAEDRVTGVLDWPGFAIADPAYDVGNTIVLLTVPYKNLAASMGFRPVDWERVVELYLAAYRTHRALNDTYLDCYKVRRCVLALVEGVEGQKVWQHPLIVQDLIATIHDITGIHISMPA